MKLIINGLDIELSDGSDIARTLQVNDIVSLENRQTNFTNTFKVPKTANNIKAFRLLGIVSANSVLPYQKNEAYLYSSSGECLVYKGFAVIKETDKKYFSVNVYDGNIDIYKAIDNKTIGNDIDLTDLNHLKTLTNVVNSWNDASPYRYIIADYNGKSLYDTNKINIDFLIPSVKVSWLWDKIFETFGFTYTGSIFNTFEFQNLWITFPKGVGDLDIIEENFNLTNAFLNNNSFSIFVNRYAITFDTYTFSNVLVLTNGYADPSNIQFTESGSYRLEFSIENVSFYDDFTIHLIKGNSIPANINEIILDDSNKVSPIIESGTTYSKVLFLDIELNEKIAFFIKKTDFNTLSGADNFTLNISKVNPQTIAFEQAFIDFSIKDFFKEIINRFALTIFKDKYSNNYDFKTLNEILQNNEVVEWQSEKIKESYIFGNYAKKNNLNYKYNDKESDYYNSAIYIDNYNLPDTKNIIDSKIYAPEKDKTEIFEKSTNVYKLWDKEPKDDGSTTYKSLDKRFYFLRSDNYIFNSPKTIGSAITSDETIITQAPFESFYKLSFNDIVQYYYNNFYRILNNSKIETHSIFLKENDILNIDFSKLYFIEAMSSYYLLNKINNFRGNGLTDVELIKVDYKIAENENIVNFDIEIDVNTDDPFVYVLNITFDPINVTEVPFVIFVNDIPNDYFVNIGFVSLTFSKGFPPFLNSVYIQSGSNISVTKTYTA